MTLKHENQASGAVKVDERKNLPPSEGISIYNNNLNNKVVQHIRIRPRAATNHFFSLINLRLCSGEN